MKYWKFVILLFLSLIILCSCSSQKKPTGTYTLWVVTEESCSDGMNYQAKEIAQRMEEEYEGLTVKLDILPTNEAEREIVLKQLRTKIMAGNGPDVYLLPTGNTLTLDYISKYNTRHARQVQIEPLFLDVVQAMQNGLFADLQFDYLSDRSLGIEALNGQIMDAGMLSGRRYILPLRYDIPVVLTDPDRWDEFGITDSLMNSDILTLTGHILNQPDSEDIYASFLLPMDLSYLSRIFDYPTQEILITPREIGNYMRIFQHWSENYQSSLERILENAVEKSLAYITDVNIREYMTPSTQEIYTKYEKRSLFSDTKRYVLEDIHWSTAGLPVYSAHLEDVLKMVAVEHLAAFAGQTDRRLLAYPLRTPSGSVVANITYWGAVGSGCQRTDIAYAFLREFLTEEYQWDIYRPRSTKKTFAIVKEPQCSALVENSWPVRTSGSVPYMLDTLQYQARGKNTYREIANYLNRQFQQLQLEDEDLPALNWEIDEVRFPITLTGEDSMEYVLSLLNEADGTPTDVDIDALAEKVWQNLWWHLAEG